MPALLLPLGLFGLFAVLLPLAVHLARRSEARILDFAALRWLRAAPRPRAQVRFDEVPLLLLRLALLALLAVLLAQPVWRGHVDRSAVVAVVPGADIVEARAALESAGDVRAVWLAPGFPAFDDTPPSAGPVASLLRELDAGLAAGLPLTIMVPGILQGVDASTPELARKVTWRVLDGAMPSAPVSKTAPLGFAVRGEASDAQLRWFRAAAAALEASLKVYPKSAPLPDGVVLLWMAPGVLPDDVAAWVMNGGTALVLAHADVAAGSIVWRDAAGPVAEVQTMGDGRVVKLLRPLQPAVFPALLEPDFPKKLQQLLSFPSPDPARVTAEGLVPREGGPTPVLAGIDLGRWLALLIALGWFIERWMATSSRRRAQP